MPDDKDKTLDPWSDDEVQNQLNSFMQNTQDDNYMKSMGKETQDIKEYKNYMEQWDYLPNYAPGSITGKKTDADIPFAEYERLGVQYTTGSPTTQNDMARAQSKWEKASNAYGRFWRNAFYDTVGGVGSMLDIEDYANSDDEVGNWLTSWATGMKEDTNKAAPIYRYDNASINDFGWWMENGSSLASSAASFIVQGGLVGGALKGLTAVKWLSKLGKAANRSKDIATGAMKVDAGIGLGSKLTTSSFIDKAQKVDDWAKKLATSTTLNQSEAIMSASETYRKVYEDGVKRGYTDEQSKRIAALSASHVVNINRANIALNLTSADLFLKGKNSLSNLVQRQKLFSMDTAKRMGTEGFQEIGEENINLIAEKQAEGYARKMLDSGFKDEHGNDAVGLNQYGMSLTDSLDELNLKDPYGDATLGEIMEASFWGFLGGAGQTAGSIAKGELGSSDGKLARIPGFSRTFGHKKSARHATTQYYPDGTLKHRKNDLVYKTKDDIYDTDVYYDVGEMIDDDVTYGKDERDEKGTELKGTKVAKGHVVQEGEQFVKHKKGETKFIVGPKGERAAVKVLDNGKDGKPQVEYEKDARGRDRYESYNEMSNRRADEAEHLIGVHKEGARFLKQASFQDNIQKAVMNLDKLITSRHSMTEEEQKIALKEVAKQNLIHSGEITLTTEQINEEVDRLFSHQDFSEKTLREKQDQLLEFSLAHNAVELFQKGAKAQLIDVYDSIALMDAETAAEKGYGKDYKKNALAAIDKINSYYNRWREFNAKHPDNIAKGLFKNRIAHDFLLHNMNEVDKKMQETHENSRAKYATENDMDNDDVDFRDKYDAGLKAVQEKNKKLDSDKTLTSLKKEHESLRKDYNDTLKKREIEDEAGEGITAMGKKKEKEALESKMLTNKKKQQDRTKEIHKKYNEKIDSLGLKGLSTSLSKQGELHRRKLNIIKEGRKLDNKFDILRSDKGKAEIQREALMKRQKAYQNHIFRQHMKELIDLQKEGGAVVFKGEDGSNFEGRVTYSNGRYNFVLNKEDGFWESGDEMTIKKWQSIVRPDMTKEYAKWAKDKTTKNEAAIAKLVEAREGIESQQTELTGKHDTKSILKFESNRKKIIAFTKRIDAGQTELVVPDKYRFYKVTKGTDENKDLALVTPINYDHRKVANISTLYKENPKKGQTGQKDHILYKKNAKLKKGDEVLMKSGSIFTSVTLSEDKAAGDTSVIYEEKAADISLPLNYKSLDNLLHRTPAMQQRFIKSRAYQKALRNRLIRITKLFEDRKGLFQKLTEDRQADAREHDETLELYNQYHQALEMIMMDENIIPSDEDLAKLKILQAKIKEATFKTIDDQVEGWKQELNDFNNKIVKLKESISSTREYIGDQLDSRKRKARQYAITYKTLTNRDKFTAKEERTLKSYGDIKDITFAEKRKVRELEDRAKRLKVGQHPLTNAERLELSNLKGDQKRYNEYKVLSAKKAKATKEQKRLEDYENSLMRDIKSHDERIKLAELDMEEQQTAMEELFKKSNVDQLEENIAKLKSFRDVGFFAKELDRFQTDLNTILESKAHYNNLIVMYQGDIDTLKGLADLMSNFFKNGDEWKDNAEARRFMRSDLLNAVKSNVSSTDYLSVISALKDYMSNQNDATKQALFDLINTFKDNPGFQQMRSSLTAFTTYGDIKLRLKKLGAKDFDAANDLILSKIAELYDRMEQSSDIVNQLIAEEIDVTEIGQTTLAFLRPISEVVPIGQSMVEDYNTLLDAIKVKLKAQEPVMKRNADKLAQSVEDLDKQRKKLKDEIEQLVKASTETHEIHEDLTEALTDDDKMDSSAELAMESMGEQWTEEGQRELQKTLQKELDIIDGEIETSRSQLKEGEELQAAGKTIVDFTEHTNRLKKAIDAAIKRKQSTENDIQLIKLMYDELKIPEFKVVLEKEVELQIKKSKEDIEVENMQKLQDDELIREDMDAIDNQLEEWNESKETLFASMGKHLLFKEGLPDKFMFKGDSRMVTDNEYDRNWFDFLNTIDNKGRKSLGKKYALKVVTVSGSNPDLDLHGLKPFYEESKSGEIVKRDKSLHGADQEFVDKGHKQGLYIVMVDKKTGEKIKHNGKFVFTTIPNGSSVSRLMGNNAILKWLFDNGKGGIGGKGFLNSSVSKWSDVLKDKNVKDGILKVGKTKYNLKKATDINKLKILVKSQMKKQIEAFRTEILEDINGEKDVFLRLTGISDGDLMRRPKIDGKRNMKSANSHISNDNFAGFVFTSIGKGTGAKARIADSSRNKIPGAPYIQHNNGTLIDVRSKTLTEHDADVVMALLKAWLPSKKGEGVTKFLEKVPIVGTDRTATLEILKRAKQNESAEITGLLNRIINWSGNRKKGLYKFNIVVDKAHIKYKGKDGIEHKLWTGILHQPAGSLSGPNKQALANFKAFLMTKRKQINKNLLNVKMGSYLHPTLDKDGNIVLEEHKSTDPKRNGYVKYLTKGKILETDVLPQSSIEKVNDNKQVGPRVGRYLMFANEQYSSLNDLKAKKAKTTKALVLEGMDVAVGQTLYHNDKEGKIIANKKKLQWKANGEKAITLSPKNIAKFSRTAPVKSEAKEKTEKKKLVIKKESKIDSLPLLSSLKEGLFAPGTIITATSAINTEVEKSDPEYKTNRDGYIFSSTTKTVEEGDETITYLRNAHTTINRANGYGNEVAKVWITYSKLTDDGWKIDYTGAKHFKSQDDKVKTTLGDKLELLINDKKGYDEWLPKLKGASKDPILTDLFDHFVTAYERDDGKAGQEWLLGAERMRAFNKMFLPKLQTNEGIVKAREFPYKINLAFDDKGNPKEVFGDDKARIEIKVIRPDLPKKFSDAVNTLTEATDPMRPFLAALNLDPDTQIKISLDPMFNAWSARQSKLVGLSPSLLNLPKKDIGVAIAHELIHQATDTYLSNNQDSDEYKRFKEVRDGLLEYLMKLDPVKIKELIDKMGYAKDGTPLLYYAVFGNIKAENPANLTNEFIDELSKYNTAEEYDNSLKGKMRGEEDASLFEFLTHLITDENLQGMLNDITVADVGIAESKESLFSWLTKLLKDITNKVFGIDIKDGSLLKEALIRGAELTGKARKLVEKNEAIFTGKKIVIIKEKADTEVKVDETKSSLERLHEKLRLIATETGEPKSQIIFWEDELTERDSDLRDEYADKTLEELKQILEDDQIGPYASGTLGTVPISPANNIINKGNVELFQTTFPTLISDPDAISDAGAVVSSVTRDLLSTDDYVDLRKNVLESPEYKLTGNYNEALGNLYTHHSEGIQIDPAIASKFDYVNNWYKANIESGVLTENIIDNSNKLDADNLKVSGAVMIGTKLNIPGLELTQQETVDIMDGMTFYLFDYFRTNDADAFFDKEVNVESVYENVRAQMRSTIMNTIAGLEEDILLISDPITKSVYDDKIDRLSELHQKLFLKNKGEAKTNFPKLAAQHAERMGSYGIKIDEDVFKSENETDSAYNKSSFEFNSKDNMPPAIKMMIAATPQMKKKRRKAGYRYVTNSIGAPKTVNFDDFYNFISKELANTPANYEMMLNKLTAVKDRDRDTSVHGASLSHMLRLKGKGRSKRTGLLRSRVIDGETNMDTNFNEVRLLNQFIQTFAKTTPRFYMARVLPNGEINYFDANNRKTSFKQLRQWQEQFIDSLPSNKSKTKAFTKTRAAEIRSDILSFQRADPNSKWENKNLLKSLEKGLRGLGMNFRNFPVLAKTLWEDGVDIGELVTGTNSVASILNDLIKDNEELGANDDLNYNPYNDRALKGAFKRLAEIAVENSTEVIDNQFINAAGQTVYGITLNHYISTVTNEINAYAGDEQTMRKELPHLFNVFTGHSKLRKMITRAEDPIKIEVALFDGLQFAGQGDVIKNLSPPNRWSMLISSTLKGIYSLYRAADRITENGFRFTNEKGATVKLYDNHVTAIDGMVEYLRDEVNAIREHGKGLGKNIKFYSDKGGKFRFFSGSYKDGQATNKTKLTKEQHDSILSQIEQGKTNAEIFTDKFVEELKSRLTEYFKDKAYGKDNKRSVYNVIKEFGLLNEVPTKFFEEIEYTAGKKKTETTKGVKSKHKTLDSSDKRFASGQVYQGISADLLRDYMQGRPKTQSEAAVALDELLLDFLVVQETAYIEQSKMFIGDPAFFKNEDAWFKRIKMFNSTKKASVTGKHLDNQMNYHSGMDLVVEDKDNNEISLDTILTEEEVTSLIENGYNLVKTLDSNRILEIQNELTQYSKGIKDVNLVPQMGFKGMNKKWDSHMKTIIMNDVVAASELAIDTVTKMEVDENNNLIYLDADNNVTQPSILRKAFAEGFVKDQLDILGKVSSRILNVKTRAYMAPYLEIDEADAQGYVTLGEYKEILVRSDSWTMGHEKAFRKLIQGKKPTTDEMFLFGVLKTQATTPLSLVDSNTEGYQNDDVIDEHGESSNLYIPAGYKHSIMPLIPSLVKGKVLEKYMDMMNRTGAGLMQYATASKFGIKTNEQGEIMNFYNENGVPNMNSKGDKFMLNNQEFVTQQIPYKYFGIQVDKNPKRKGKVTVGTQFRKLILSNLIEQGSPVDYIDSQTSFYNNNEEDQPTGWTGMSYDEKLEIIRDDWSDLTEAQKEDQSNLYSITQEYKRIQATLIETPLNELIDELGLEPQVDTNDNITGYKITNRKALVDIVLASAVDRNIPDNIKVSITELANEDAHIEQIINKEKVENIMYAIVNSRVIQEKRSGEGAPQVSVTGMEALVVDEQGNIVDSPSTRTYTDDDKKVLRSSPALRSYRPSSTSNQTLAATCMIALPSKEWVKWVDQEFENGLDGLNGALDVLHVKLDQIEDEGKTVQLSGQEKKLKTLITLVGFRIPTQGLNTSDYMRVRRFLPYAFADSIVVFSEMVAKAGSDYDYDKLTVYLPNADILWDQGDMDIRYTSYKTDDNSTVEERYDEFIDRQPLKLNDTQKDLLGISNLNEENKALHESFKTQAETERFTSQEAYRTAKAEYKEELNEEIKAGIKVSKVALKAQVDRISRTFGALPRTLKMEYWGEEQAIKSQSAIEKTIFYKQFTESYLNYYKEQFELVPDGNKDSFYAEYATARKDRNGNEITPEPFLLKDVVEDMTTMVEQYDALLDMFGAKGLGKKVADEVKKRREEEGAFKTKVIDTTKAIQEEGAERLMDIKISVLDAQDANKEIIKEIIRDAKIAELSLMSKSDFGKMPLEKQNSKKALQNRMIEIHETILKQPYNYRQLSAPITDVPLNDLELGAVWDIRLLESNEEAVKELYEAKKEILQTLIDLGHVKGYMKGSKAIITDNANNTTIGNVILSDEGKAKFKEAFEDVYLDIKGKWAKNRKIEMRNKPLSDITDPVNNMEKFLVFLEGKVSGVGMTAVQITNHQLTMAAGVHLTNADPYWVFEHNKMKVGENYYPSFANKRSMDAEWISETLSAFATAYVDVAADPYIFEMNAGRATGNTVLMLVRAGAPVKWVARFMSQPIIKKYVKEQMNNEAFFRKAYGGELKKKELVQKLIPKETKTKTLLSFINEGIDAKIATKYESHLLGNPSALGEIHALEAGRKRATNGIWSKYKAWGDAGLFSEEALGDYIARYNDPEGTIETNEFIKDNAVYKEMQSAVLDLFLEYQRQSKHFQEMIRGGSADTKRTGKNKMALLSRLETTQKVKDLGQFGNYSEMISETVVNKFQHTLEQANMFYNDMYFIHKDPIIKDNLRELYNDITPYVIGADAKSRAYDVIINDFLAAVVTMQDEENSNSLSPAVTYETLFVHGPKNKYYNKHGDIATLPEIILELNDKTLQHNQLHSRSSLKKGLWSVRGNQLIKELLSGLPKEEHSWDKFNAKGKVGTPNHAYLQLMSRKMTTQRSNDLTTAAQLLKEAGATNPLIKGLYANLVRATIVQSGFNNTPFTFTNLVPADDINSILKSKLDKFASLDEYQRMRVMEVFKSQFKRRNLAYNPGLKRIKQKRGVQEGKDSFSGFKYETDASNHVAKSTPFLVINKRTEDGEWQKWAVQGQNIWKEHKGAQGGFDAMYGNRNGYIDEAVHLTKEGIVGHLHYLVGYNIDLNTINEGASAKTVKKIEIDEDAKFIDMGTFNKADKSTGTGADIQMRLRADGFIGESGGTASSTRTSGLIIARKDDDTPTSHPTESTKYYLLEEGNNVIMLARNYSRVEKPLDGGTKQAIDHAIGINPNVKFIFGNSATDKQFLSYLKEVGHNNYSVYGYTSGTKKVMANRISLMDATSKPEKKESNIVPTEQVVGRDSIPAEVTKSGALMSSQADDVMNKLIEDSKKCN